MSRPTWTVVIPTRDRPDTIGAAAEAVMALTPPPGGFELVIVDDGGDTDLGPLAQHPRLRVHRQKQAGPAAARNAGAALARGDLLAFTDDDCRPRPEWLIRLAERLRVHPNAAVGGRTINALTTNPFTAASQDVVDYFYQAENPDPGDAQFFASNNIALSRDAFEDIGGFDERYPLAAGEDRAFCDRWRTSGRPLLWSPEAIVMHHHHLTARSFWRQHFRYGRGAYCFHAQRAARKTGRSKRINPLAYYGRLIAHPLRSDHGEVRLRRVGLLMLAQAATAAGYAREGLSGTRH